MRAVYCGREDQLVNASMRAGIVKIPIRCAPWRVDPTENSMLLSGIVGHRDALAIVICPLRIISLSD